MRYIALLRGINVGGHNKIKMDDLRSMFDSLGFSNVSTYIASGNVAFDARKAKDSSLIDKIENAITSNFGLEIDVMVRTIDEIEQVISANPFADMLSEETNLYLVFLKDKLADDKARDLISHNNEFETFVVNGRDIYCLSKKGFIKSILGKKYIDNKLKTPATARNWRTVNKIAKL